MSESREPYTTRPSAIISMTEADRDKLVADTRMKALEDALIAIDDSNLYESRGQERYIKSLIRKLMERG